MGDLFILHTECTLTDKIRETFEASGYTVKVGTGATENALCDAEGFSAVCLFVNRKIHESQVARLRSNGNKVVLHCSAGFDNSPTKELKEAGIAVMRVPSYSPSSIAEFAVSNMFALAKKVEVSTMVTKEADFTIDRLECLLVETRTCGVVGTGNIGKKTAQKMSGLVAKVLCFDAFPDEEWIKSIPNAEYVDLDTLLTTSHLISIHVPLLPETRNLFNKHTFGKMQRNVIVVNTSRGGVVHNESLLEALEDGTVFGAALDVFEGEEEYIFKDRRVDGFKNNPVVGKLAQHPNVVLSSHIAFYTSDAVQEIALKTLANYEAFIGKGQADEKAIVCSW